MPKTPEVRYVTGTAVPGDLAPAEAGPRESRNASHPGGSGLRAPGEMDRPGSPEVIARFDSSLRYLYVNGAAARSLGRPAVELIGRTQEALGAEGGHVAERTRRLRRVFRTGSEDRFEYAADGPEGPIWLQTLFAPEPGADGEVTSVLEVTRDLTRARAVEEALVESERKYRAFFENSMDAVLLTSPCGGVFQANPAACTLLGYTEAEICAIGRAGLVDAGDPRVAEVLEERSRSGSVRGELTVVRNDGARIPVEVSSVVFVDEQGEERSSMILRDVREQRRMAEALRQSEVRFRALIEEASDAIVVFGREGNVRYESPAQERLLGWKDGLVGQSCLHHLVEDGLPLAREAFRDCLEHPERPSVVELRSHHADGSVRTLEVRLRNLLDNPGVGGIVANARDITERKRSEAFRGHQTRVLEMLAREHPLGEVLEELVRAAEAQADLRCAILLAEGGGRSLRMGAAPSLPEALRAALSHLPIEESTGPSGTAAFRREDVVIQDIARETTASPIRDRVLAAGIASAWSRPILSTGGELLGVVSTFYGEPRSPHPLELELVDSMAQIAAIAIEKTRSDAELRRKTEILERAVEGIAHVDASGRFVSVNPAYASLAGRPAESLVGMHWREVLHPDELEVAEDAMTTMRETERAEFESRILRPDGTELHKSVLLIPVHDEHGRWAGHFRFVRDVGEAKRAEAALRHTEAQLRQSQKLEAIGRLAGGIAHDFNNVLTAIKGIVQLHLLDLPDGDPLREDMQEIDSSATRAASLTRQLLAFSRQQVMQPRVLDLGSLTTALESMLRPLVGEHIVVRTRVQPGLGAVRADPGQLEQVLLNLAVNARDAMPGGGKLRIALRDVSLEAFRPEIVPGPYVLIEMEDSGEGIDPEDRERIFEPFFTTRGQPWAGLGLSTAYGIVKQSGGYIYAESVPGEGTTMRVYLPRVDALSEEEPRAPAQASRRASETVLLVEDEPSVRSLARRILSRQGYEVVEAEDGARALQLASSHPRPIDLLLTDVVMPGMSGRQLADRLVETQPRTRVLYMSGYTDDQIARHGILEPGISFLEKPFSREFLLQRVREVLDGR